MPLKGFDKEGNLQTVPPIQDLDKSTAKQKEKQEKTQEKALKADKPKKSRKMKM